MFYWLSVFPNRVSGEITKRIMQGTVNCDFKMQMGAGGNTGGACIAYDLSLRYGLTGAHCGSIHMCV